MPGRLCPACSGTLRWIAMESGRLYPVDPVPTPQTGTVAARLVGNRYVAGYVLAEHRPLRPGFTRFDPHTTSCTMRRQPLRTPRPDRLF